MPILSLLGFKANPQVMGRMPNCFLHKTGKLRQTWLAASTRRLQDDSVRFVPNFYYFN